MNIERNEPIRFHEKGTLEAVTRWIATHNDGIAEWLKNVRRQYQVDRANVAENHRVAALLLQDASDGKPARIGVLDVGGATLEDVTAWSVWQDTSASHRGSGLQEEETQGNGGKAYMYRLFGGPARIIGIRDRRRNCKGFDGEVGTVERGTPGWMPNLAAGRDVQISSFDVELGHALEPYGLSVADLPTPLRTAIVARKSFTLVEGEGPLMIYKGQIDADEFIAKVVRHEQSTLCLEQVDVFAIHNGRVLNDGKKLELPPIIPYPGIDSPTVHEVPDQLELDNGQTVSTTEGGTKPKGRLILHTSLENMPNAYRNLRPRWQVVYRTRHQMIGSKPISELAPATPGAAFIYGTVELPASGKLIKYPAFDGLIIEALLEGGDGTIWVLAGRALPESRLCSIRKERTHCYGEDGGAGFGITTIYEDSRGTLWAGGMKGVWRWDPGPPKFYPMEGPEERTYGLTETDDGAILVARAAGITKLTNGKFERYPFPPGLKFPPAKLLRDRNGGLWIGALVDQGLLHIHQGKTDLFTSPEGVFGDLSGHQVRCFFEDREGSIWVSTPSGLDRFREFAIPAVSVPQGLSSRGVNSILAGKDGSIWLATSDGLNRWKEGRVEIYRNRSGPLSGTLGGFTTAQFAEPGTTTREIVDAGFPPQEVTSLFEDNAGRIWVATLEGVAFLESGRFVPVRSVPPGNVFSIIGDRAENVWMSHEEGLFHLEQARLVERISWAKLGRNQPASALLHDPVQGGLWLGFHDGGVAFFRDGQLRTYASTQGLAEGIVHSFYRDGSGALWVAAVGGLSRIKDDRILTLTSRNGLPCDNVHWMMEDDFHSVWLYTACGLVRMARSELDAWVFGSKHVTQLTVFDTSDGVGIHPNLSRESPLVAKATDGRLWFIGHEGASIIDPRHLAYNRLPPPVHIEQVTADDKPYDAQNGMRLPRGVRNLAIDYTALSVVVPEKVRFRYKLEGQNRNWHEVVNDREVQYTNLSPGAYRFRVVACNNSGVWNEEGATLDFVIPPMWYQTNWFYALCVAAFVGSLWAAYQLRVRQLAHQFNMRLEERVTERTRIARDLHDTLLQSFQALLPRLQASINMFASRPDEARRNLEQAADQASQAIAEGRDAIQGMRMSTVEKNNLAAAIRTLGEELASAATHLSSPNFNVVVEGTSRNLHPILRDEVYRLTTEALRNAFRHAAAQNVEVEIRYDEKYFRLRVRDDGKGIPSDVLSGDGREGHYGLPGMRERAKLVGGKLTIWTEVDGGTEIELNIPGARAFVKSTRPFWYFGKRSATIDEKEPIERE